MLGVVGEQVNISSLGCYLHNIMCNLVLLCAIYLHNLNLFLSAPHTLSQPLSCVYGHLAENKAYAT